MIKEESIMNKLLKQRLFSRTAIVLLLTSVGMSVQAKTDLTELASELEIMTSILQTSLRQESKDSAIRTGSIDVTYLFNQGVVFDISTTAAGRHFNFEFSSLPSVPPIPAMPIDGFEQKWVVEIENDEWQEVSQQAMEHAHEALQEASERLRDLRERSRDYNWQIRDYERERRDLEFEMRNTDSQRKAEIQTELKELESEIKSIQLKQKEAQEFANQLEKEQKLKAAEKAKALKEQYSQFVANFENNVSTALCKYGAGIKALDLSENINFVLSNFTNSSRNSRQDRIYVFKQKDVQDCVKDKLDAKKLLSKAEIYTF